MDAKMIEMLGLSQEELRTRVVNKIAHDLMSAGYTDENGEECAFDSAILKDLRRCIDETVSERVESYGETHVKPNLVKFIDGMMIQPTNAWGEKKSPAMTFTEFMIKKAEEYVHEKVDYKGKTKGEDSFGWSASQTRLAHMMHEHLAHNIDQAVKVALRSVNESVGKAIADTAKIKLDEIVKGLQVAVKVP